MNHVLKDERERGWFHLDNAVIDEYLPKIGATAFAVYACIVRAMDDAGQADPSYTTLQHALGKGRGQIAAAIKRLVGAGLVTIEAGKRNQNIYRVVGTATSSISELVPFQNQSQIETRTSSISEPVGVELVPNQNQSQESTPSSPLPALPPAPPLSPIPPIAPQRTREGTPEVLRTSAPTSAYPIGFETWWQACPLRMRRCAKSEAAKAWKNLNGSRPELAAMLDVLALQAESHDWTKEGGRFIPMATTYLHKRRWEADVGSMEIGTQGFAQPGPITFEQQKQINNAKAWEELDAIVLGKRPDHGLRTHLQAADEPPRRRLPAGDPADDDGGVLDGVCRER